MNRQPKRGGKRKGAGRPPIAGEALTKTSITLTAAQAAKAVKAGEGNLAEGVRRLIDRATP